MAKVIVTRLGLDPRTLSVQLKLLRTRDNQLHHPANFDSTFQFDNYILLIKPNDHGLISAFAAKSPSHLAALGSSRSEQPTQPRDTSGKRPH